MSNLNDLLSFKRHAVSDRYMQPDYYRQQHGECPRGWHYDVKSKQCVRDDVVTKVVHAPAGAIGNVEHAIKAKAEEAIKALTVHATSGQATPGSIAKIGKALGFVASTALKAGYATWIAGEAAVAGIAKAKGLTPIEASRLRTLCTFYDATTCKAIFTVLHHNPDISYQHPTVAAAMMFTPVVSAAYVVVSTVAKPLLVARAAAAAIQKLKAKFTKAKTEDAQLDASDAVSKVADALKGKGDWYYALLLAAISCSDSIDDAIALANDANTQPATTTEAAGQTPKTRIQYYEDPSMDIIRAWLAKHTALRGTYAGGHLYIWPAYDMTHDDFQKEMALSFGLGSMFELFRRGETIPLVYYVNKAVLDPRIKKLANDLDATLTDPDESISESVDGVLKNPSQGELQALFDTVAGKRQYIDAEDVILRGIIKKNGTAHTWGDAYKYTHGTLCDHGQHTSNIPIIVGADGRIKNGNDFSDATSTAAKAGLSAMKSVKLKPRPYESIAEAVAMHPDHKAAIKEFGTTSDPNEAGWILPNGKMLDFSEKNDGGMPGMRSLDHRSVSRLYSDAEMTQAMIRFRNTGAVRWGPEGQYIDYVKSMTDAQKRVITNAYRGGSWYMDHRDESGTVIGHAEGDDRMSLSRALAGELQKPEEYNPMEALSEAKREQVGNVTMTWNPTAKELADMVRKNGELRGIPFGKDYGFWPAYEAVHIDVAYTLGIKSADDWYPYRTSVVPYDELHQSDDGNHDYFSRSSGEGSWVIFSPDYGKGLSHPRIEAMHLKSGKGGNYDGDWAWVIEQEPNESMDEVLTGTGWRAGSVAATDDLWRQDFFVGKDQYRFRMHREPSEGDDAWQLIFSKVTDDNDEELAATGTGNQFAVFSAVSTMLKDFLDKKKPKVFLFSASKISRIKLYRALAKRILAMGDYEEVPKFDGDFYFKRKGANESMTQRQSFRSIPKHAKGPRYSAVPHKRLVKPVTLHYCPLCGSVTVANSDQPNMKCPQGHQFSVKSPVALSNPPSATTEGKDDKRAKTTEALKIEKDKISGVDVEYVEYPEAGDDDSGMEFGEKYLSVGHGTDFSSDSSRVVLYYAPPSGVKVSDIHDDPFSAGTHGGEWGHSITDNYYKGRFELDTGALSVAPPSGVETVPEAPLKRIIAFFKQFSRDNEGAGVKKVVVLGAPEWATAESIEFDATSTTEAVKPGVAEKVKLQYEVTGYSHGQMDGYVVARVDGKVVGKINWTSYEGETSVKFVEVDPAWRRQGIATLLYQKLQKENGEPIAGSMMTPDGTALRKALAADGTIKQPDREPDEDRLKRLYGEAAKLNTVSPDERTPLRKWAGEGKWKQRTEAVMSKRKRHALLRKIGPSNGEPGSTCMLGTVTPESEDISAWLAGFDYVGEGREFNNETMIENPSRTEVLKRLHNDGWQRFVADDKNVLMVHAHDEIHVGIYKTAVHHLGWTPRYSAAVRVGKRGPEVLYGEYDSPEGEVHNFFANHPQIKQWGLPLRGADWEGPRDESFNGSAYTDIGHGGKKATLWGVNKDTGEFHTQDVSWVRKTHDHCPQMKNRWIWGRADHDAKKISLVALPEVPQRRIEYAKKQVVKKWPGYDVEDMGASWKLEATREDPFAEFAPEQSETFRQFVVYLASWMGGASTLTMTYGIKEVGKIWKANPWLRAWLAKYVNPKSPVQIYYGASGPGSRPEMKAPTIDDPSPRTKGQDIYNWSTDPKTSIGFSGINGVKMWGKNIPAGNGRFGYLVRAESQPSDIIVDTFGLVKLAQQFKKSFADIVVRSDAVELFTTDAGYSLEHEVFTAHDNGKVIAGWKYNNNNEPEVFGEVPEAFVDYVKDNAIFSPKTGTAVFKNPTAAEWKEITKDGPARVLFDPDTGDLHAWKGAEALHGTVRDKLALKGHLRAMATPSKSGHIVLHTDDAAPAMALTSLKSKLEAKGYVVADPNKRLSHYTDTEESVVEATREYADGITYLVNTSATT